MILAFDTSNSKSVQSIHQNTYLYELSHLVDIIRPNNNFITCLYILKSNCFSKLKHYSPVYPSTTKQEPKPFVSCLAGMVIKCSKNEQVCSWAKEVVTNYYLDYIEQNSPEGWRNKDIRKENQCMLNSKSFLPLTSQWISNDKWAIITKISNE